jgi:anti-sigma B factor antagonist
MNTESKDSTLYVSDIRELTAVTAMDIKKQLREAFASELKNLECNCTTLDFIDSSGLGALISMQKLANERGGKLRLVSPKPNVIQILELTRLHRVFEILA